MSSAFASAFADKLNSMIEVYLESYALAYDAFGMPHQNFEPSLALYKETIKANMQNIRVVAGSRIAAYIYMYNVQISSPDELKLIYFVGRAIAWQLRQHGHTAIAPVHLFAMLGLLDDRLRYLGINKPRLLTALAKLVEERNLFKELGPTGTYLLYKCLSTVREGLEEPKKLN